MRRLLRPLVRLLIERSIPLPFVTELLRGLYVEVAVKEFPVEGKRQTDSRVNLLTGVHRKDVKRLRAHAVFLEDPRQQPLECLEVPIDFPLYL